MTEQEFSRAVERYGDMLYRVAFHYCKNKPDADDLVQNAFIKFLRTKKHFESEEHLRNWLIRVVINDSKKLLVSPWKTRHAALEDYAETLYAGQPERSEVFFAVMELPQKERVAVHLYYYEGYSVKEIGALLGENPSTVSTRLASARKRLKSKLREAWNSDE